MASTFATFAVRRFLLRFSSSPRFGRDHSALIISGFLRPFRWLNNGHHSFSYSTHRTLSPGILETEQWAERMIEHKLSGRKCCCFSDLVHWWHSNVFEPTLHVHGIRLLVKIALDKEQQSDEEQSEGFSRKRKGAIADLWEYVKDTMSASDFLGFLVLELVEREQLEEANIFSKLLTIHGSSFALPLRLLMWRASVVEEDNFADNLRQEMANEDEEGTQNQQLRHAQRVVEQLCAIVQECYFDVQKMKGKKRGRRKEEQAKDSTLIAESRYQSLLWLWMPSRVCRFWRAKSIGNESEHNKKMRKPRNSSRQMHRMDAREVAKLGQLLVKLWADIATKQDDAEAWSRLMDYVEHNELPMDEQLIMRWEDRCDDDDSLLID